ncbi:MAG: hypothetical protein ACLFPI_11835 [Desulfobacterales bacterium]
MKDTGSFHKKMQEHIDCYAETDYLTELAKVKDEQDVEQAALNWLALSVLHGINSNAEKISLKKSDDGGISVTAEYRGARLPAPPGQLAEKIVEIVRNIAHIESDKGEIPLAVGLRNSSLDLKIKVKKKDGKEKIELSFPETKK